MSDPVEVQPAILYASRRKWALVNAAAGIVFFIVGLIIERTTDLNGITFIGLGVVYFVVHSCIALWAHRKLATARLGESLTLEQDLESDSSSSAS